ncbi:MAG TPA: hypothetical protein VEI57_10035 [Nitrospirota bacterium]|nr:hypothetical protein [Nitrospirota bacterium]
MNLLTIAFFVFLLNIPFGYWRANVRKFSFAWFLSVHAPVPFIIALRLLSGMGFQLITFPIMIAAYFVGQFAGSRLYTMRRKKDGLRVSSCLVWDLVSPHQKRY